VPGERRGKTKSFAKNVGGGGNTATETRRFSAQGEKIKKGEIYDDVPGRFKSSRGSLSFFGHIMKKSWQGGERCGWNHTRERQKNVW